MFGEIQEAHTNGFAALVFAWVGDGPRAESLLADLARQLPEGTLINSIDLPTVRARLELSRNNPAASVQLLQVALPYEFSAFELGGCLTLRMYEGWPISRRRTASPRATEFKKILDHPWIVNACGARPLAHLGLARAYVLQRNSAKAKGAYQDLLILWKDADPDVPILKQAKAEFAKLQ